MPTTSSDPLPPPSTTVPAAPLAAPTLVDESVGAITKAVTTLASGTATGGDLDRLFRGSPELDCVVIHTGGRPSHLVTREFYYAKTGGAYGFAVYQKRPVEAIAKPDPLVVPATSPLRQLARLALARPREDQYDPVIVVNAAGTATGIVTIEQLLQRAAELEVRIAQLTNPLTRLPGSPVIQEWIEKALAADRDGGLTVVFTELADFKEYNDIYGLEAGDELVRRAAQALAELQALIGPEAQVGHAGADRFVVVCPHPIDTDALRATCARFDHAKLDLFLPADVERGYFEAQDDRGNPVRLPLVLMTLTMVTSSSLREARHPAGFAQRAAHRRRTALALANALGSSAFVANEWLDEPR